MGPSEGREWARESQLCSARTLETLCETQTHLLILPNLWNSSHRSLSVQSSLKLVTRSVGRSSLFLLFMLSPVPLAPARMEGGTYFEPPARISEGVGSDPTAPGFSSPLSSVVG